ncbi:hypothetical protein [Leifsonia sp. C5G2]|uniref:hypothetical protein n=1 Tax=Leifsonia sp. C5G2 TaxID=2735269 RepID=UPI0015854C8C|nr:hypothetical protein [Leifsonia sp. C5G2]NUU06365.1 hypothetical protein [Leifsonia sp. C5G2]
MATRTDRDVPRRRIADDRGVHVASITNATFNEGGWIDAHLRGHNRLRRTARLGRSIAADQVNQSLLAHLHVGGGTWTSFETLYKHSDLCKHFLRRLRDDFDIHDLTDPNLNHQVVWEGILLASPAGGSQRNLRTFLAETFAVARRDGETYRDYLYARTLVVDESDVEGYAPEVADAIEAFTKGHVGDWFLRHRRDVEMALGTLPRDWMTRPAQELISGHPHGAAAFRVTSADLAAAMILLALIDNKGPNLSTIQSYTVDSVERSNEDAAFVTGIKARNHQVLKTPAPAGGIFSYAGLLEFVAAATRVARHLRDQNEDFSRLLFVTSRGQQPMSGANVNNWWERTESERDKLGQLFPDTISFQRLRKAALLRGPHKDFAVIGQKKATTRLYLADAVPDVILIPGLLNTQADVTSYWRSKTKAPSATPAYLNDEEAAAAAALEAADAIMDVGVAACISNGQSPTDQTKPCGLGPVACFVCPNGYRTPETIPGLIAAVEFTDNIRKYEPNEWLDGDAPILNELAKKTLERFPQPLIDAAPTEEIHNVRALIACVYVETRTRD